MNEEKRKLKKIVGRIGKYTEKIWLMLWFTYGFLSCSFLLNSIVWTLKVGLGFWGTRETLVDAFMVMMFLSSVKMFFLELSKIGENSERR